MLLNKLASKLQLVAMLLMTTLLACASLHAAELTAEQKAKAEQYIKGLNDDDFTKREEAQKALIALGADALPFLKDALAKSDDPELKVRLNAVINEVTPVTTKIVDDASGLTIEIEKDNHILAGTKNGSWVWRAHLTGKPLLSLALRNGKVVVKEEGGVLITVDPRNGSIIQDK